MAKKKPKGEPKVATKDTAGAMPGLCVHRVPVTSFCNRCGA